MTRPASIRPGSVTVVVVLIWISAVLGILSGVLLLIISSQLSGSGGSGVVLTIGIFVLLIGLITAAVANRLAKGGNGARLIVSFLQVLDIAGAIATIAAVGGRNTIGQSIATIIISAIVLALLWNRRANDFFAH